MTRYVPLILVLSAEWSGGLNFVPLVMLLGKSNCLISPIVMQNVAVVTASSPDAFAWSHIDSCLTSGQHGQRRYLHQLVPQPAQRDQAWKSGLLLIGSDQG